MISSTVIKSKVSYRPAPYGQACAACSRAKCKCFIGAAGGQCERCHRLAKPCRPTKPARKRNCPAAAPPSRVEEKLDDPVTLLRSGVPNNQNLDLVQSLQPTPLSHVSPISALAGTARENLDSSGTDLPEIGLDTDRTVIDFLRPEALHDTSHSIFDDVSIHHIKASIVNARLKEFRQVFLPIFPFFHMPETMTGAELQRQNPFLWLVIMALITRDVSEQFTIENTIWRIISDRVVLQHLADLDLLVGIICFASWSHYFKKDKPFMTKLTQLAVCVAFDLNLHTKIPTRRHQISASVHAAPGGRRSRASRTIEERRSLLALFHLTSCTFTAYSESEPMRWTAYFDECVNVIRDEAQSELDVLLVFQVECQLLAHFVTCPSGSGPSHAPQPQPPSSILINHLLRRLRSVWSALPASCQEMKSAKLCFYNTEAIIRGSVLRTVTVPTQGNEDTLRRLQNLDLTLTSIERWLEIFLNWRTGDWPGINVDIFSQFTQCLVFLFKLSTLEQPGWDAGEVKRRADMFEILDRLMLTAETVPQDLGMVDADGPRRGLFFKAKDLFGLIKSLLASQMPREQQPVDQVQLQLEDLANLDDFWNAEADYFADDFLLALWDE